MLTEKLYTVNEGAAALNLSPWTLWDHLKRGLIMRTKVCGKTFIRESELKKLITDSVNRRKLGKKRASKKEGQ